ncbi:MAG: metal-dependent transcriptional regulator [Candidatus Micrarchaeia archaeon]|jgi:Mn-dependent DtxR family transcriptional regulator
MQQETIENYCKTALELDKGDGVKSVDIANSLGISKISVSITLQKLKQEGFVSMKKYGRVKLTQKGICVAKKIDGKYCTLEGFLQKCLGVEKQRAKKEACAIEHCLSDDTIKRLVAFCGKKKN